MVRTKSKKIGKTYNIVSTRRFNSFINSSNLLELSLSDRKFSWAISISFDSFALLDRFLCSIPWNSHYFNSLVTYLPRV
jgi:hypothetical protein